MADDRKCSVCGGTFAAVRNRKTCSDLCARTHLRRLWLAKAELRRADPEKREHDNAIRRANERRRVRRRERRKVAAGLSRCAVCGSAFRPRARKVTCGPKCLDTWKRRLRWAKNHPPTARRSKGLRCPLCRVLFCPLGRGRYKGCSPDCRRILRRRYLTARQRRLYATDPAFRRAVLDSQRRSKAKLAGAVAAAELAALARELKDGPHGRPE